MRKVLSLVGAAALLAAAGATSVFAQPTPPTRFFGSATVNGQPAANGTTVTATIGGTNCGSGTVSNGSYSVDVASGSTKPGCGTNGAEVSFQIGSATANETRPFQTGAFVPLDLTAGGAAAPTTVATTRPTVAPTTVATTRPTTAPTTRPVTTVVATQAPRPSATTIVRPIVTGTPAAVPTSAPGAQAQRPSGPAAQAPSSGAAAPASQSAGATPRLPSTGAATASDSSSMLMAGGLAALLMVLGLAGVAVYRRR